MRITFFYTSYCQLEINKNIYELFNLQLKKLNYELNALDIYIIIHNNNKDYNYELLLKNTNINGLMNCKYVKDVKLIHTVKNEGYLWGAQEALCDNYDLYKDMDFVIHLNTNIFVKRIDTLIKFLFDNIKYENTVFFVNEFIRRKIGEYGFKTDFTIFKPKINFYSFYKNELFLKSLKCRIIPENVIKQACLVNNYSYKLLPNIFIPFELRITSKYKNNLLNQAVVCNVKYYDESIEGVSRTTENNIENFNIETKKIINYIEKIINNI